MSEEPTAAAAHIVGWMVEQALATITVGDAFEGLISRLRDEGVDISRAHLGYTTLHPLHRGSGATWTRDGGIETETYTYDRDQQAAGWYDSPIFHAIENEVERTRRRLSGPSAMLDFPILRELAVKGLHDYLLLCCPFDSFYTPMREEQAGRDRVRSGLALSFATSRETGFSDEEIATLHWLLKPFALMVKMADQRQVAETLASCYIGREAGPRVLGGAIQRGDFSSTPAVVWLSDLRASTEMSMTMPRDEFIATINEFFDCTAGAVDEEGGEPLTFIGDGLLAIFPIERLGETGARAAAFRAAKRANAALASLNEVRARAGRRKIGWGVALHAGVLEYGNIGSLARHSWTAIGAVVNETARLEGMTKVVKEPVVASRAFVEGFEAAERSGWREMGAFDLQGVTHPFDVFAPPVAAQHRTKEPAL